MTPIPTDKLRIASFGEGERHADATLHSDAPAPLDALRALARAHPSGDLILVENGCVLPPLWLERLLRTATQSREPIVTALGNAEPELSPFAAGTQRALQDPLAFDRSCYLHAQRRTFATRRWLRSCSLWRREALDWLLAHPDYAAGPLPPTLAAAVCDHLFVADPRLPCAGPPLPEDARETAPASPLALLHARFAPLACAAPCTPGLDRRPVVLHVLHGWGGGAETFVRDLARADHDRCHLALVARGNSSRRRYGEQLELVLPAADMAVLRRWPLATPIEATVEGSDDYRAVLGEVLRDWCVDALAISSLIGHSLDALRTALPTVWVAHDYYPAWPVLHCDFGDGTRRFDASELSAELARSAGSSPFGERDPAVWQRLREAWVEAALAARVELVSPSESAQANLLRIEPRLGALNRRVIAHGFRPFDDDSVGQRPTITSPLQSNGAVAHSATITPPLQSNSAVARSATITSPLPDGERAKGEGGPTTPAHDPRGRATGEGGPASPARKPRVLVLGRIAGGKGADLLDRVVALAADAVDFHLLGCGKAGERFFGRAGVTLELDYERDELPRHVARIAPDLALMPATVAETYSYTLSELWALRVPPLATALGSLEERITRDGGGWLVPPQADAVAQRLRELAGDGAARDTVRTALARISLRDCMQMANDYAACWPREHGAPARYVLAPVAASELALSASERERVALQAANAQQRDTLAAQLRELGARADWAVRMEKLSKERTAWARSLEHDLGEAREVLSDTQGELERTARELGERSAQLVHYRNELDITLASRSWRITQPLRSATDLLSRMRTGAAFRRRRAKALLARARLSLKLRGYRGTLARAMQGLAPRRAPPQPPQIPASEPFLPFALPASDAPRVSIVIPVHNHFDHTLTCLRSLAAHPGTVPFEVIVVDDASGDETAQRLGEIGGVRSLRNEQNLGFVGSCNAGAALARGEFVLLLNNDTAVTPGWIEALLATFDAFPDAGLVGAKLVYPDGRLQEAGGIVFADGSGWNYGRFGDPSDCAYEYVREVDYCSGAAIVLRRELWQRFGGFDTRYAPAYYEDTDLAFRVREAGMRVYYQPAATVVHFEGVTSGTDTASGVKRYQVVNQEKFVARWRDALARQPQPGTPIALAREHRARARVLIVDACTPTPDQDSGSVRMVNLMRVLTGLGWKVSFFAENLMHDAGYTKALQQLGVEALYYPWLGDVVHWFREHGAALDAVVLSRHYVASVFLPLAREYAPRARIVFDTVDLHYLREERAAQLEDHPQLRKLAASTRAQELMLVRSADVTLVVSPVEQELLRLECPGARVEVLSNVHPVVGARRAFGQRSNVLFVGGFQHPPNVDAMLWFVQAVWPRVAAELPGVRFHVIGSRMVEEVEALASDSVVIHGFVSDLDPYLDGCRVAIAPLRYGAGVKGKVNMSMAHGQPVVATPMAVEGMHIRPGEDVLVAEDAASFADAIVRAYRDEELWNTLSRNGIENVRKHFSFDAAREALQRILPKR